MTTLKFSLTGIALLMTQTSLASEYYCQYKFNFWKTTVTISENGQYSTTCSNAEKTKAVRDANVMWEYSCDNGKKVYLEYNVSATMRAALGDTVSYGFYLNECSERR